ncbi:MAG TPA: CoA-binding protein [Syntrophomonadaceae bacterium]|jgi:predicted CoA-binding protein|nr:CoA-binding protein [Syntrophomonadaceae bacterium]
MNDFFQRFNRLAVLGLSRNPKAFSRQAYSFLLSKGYDLYPVNPNADSIDGQTCYPTVDALPSVQGAIFFTPPQITAELLPLCQRHGIKDVWFQQGAADPKVLKEASQLGISYVDSCVFMHHPESGFPHNVHRFMVKIFGKGQ